MSSVPVSHASLKRKAECDGELLSLQDDAAAAAVADGASTTCSAAATEEAAPVLAPAPASADESEQLMCVFRFRPPKYDAVSHPPWQFCISNVFLVH
jgi:hypothetical protein